MTGITPTHAIERPDTPEQDAARMEWLHLARLRTRLDALRKVAVHGSFEAEFVRRTPEGMDGGELRLVERLLWHYRRQLPRHLAPKLPPDDPVVMETRAREDALV